MNCLYLLRTCFRNIGFALFLLLAAEQTGFGQYTDFSLHMPLVSAQQFDTVILPVSVKGFNPIISTGLFFSWDQDAIQAIEITLPALNPLGLTPNANFLLNQSGKLTFTWFDPAAAGVTLSDNTVIFEIKFKVLTPDSGFFPVHLDVNAAYGNEVVGSWSYALLPAALQIGGVYTNTPAPQSLEINKIWADHPLGCPPQTGGGIYFNSINNGTPPYDAVWTGPNGYVATGQSISDILAGEYFLQITDALGLTANAQVLLGQNGCISCFSLKMPAVYAQQNDTISLPVTVKGFEDIYSLQLNMTWDPDAFQFESLNFPGGNKLGLSNANFNPNQPGSLLFNWYDPNAWGVNLSDGDTLFMLQFKVLTAESGFFPIRFDSVKPYLNELNQNQSDYQSLPLQVGGVYANTPAQATLQIENFCATSAQDCNNPTGSISGSVSGGTAPYTLSWTGPLGFTANSFNLSNLLPGLYDLTITDGAGIAAQAQVLIYTQYNPIQLSGQVQAASCAENDGCIHLSATTGNWPITYNWSAAGLEGKDVCDLAPGTYAVTATDAGGCSLVDSFEVAAGSSLLIDILITAANCVNNQLGTALALPQNGLAPYQYLWSTTDDAQLITGLFSGVYEVTVTDVSGCSGTAQTYISDATIISWDLYLQTNCIGGNGQGDVLLRAGNPAGLQYPVTLIWQNGTTQIVSAPAGDTLGGLQMLPSGLYSLTVIDSSGCGQVLEESLNCFGPAPADSAALVWPGDADNNNAVNHHDLLYLGLAYGATGPTRDNATINWTGQPATDWSQSTGGNPVNFKNLDTNGDGIINAADTLAITMNWGQVIDPLADNPFAAAQTLPGMGPTPAPALSLPADTLFAGQTVYIPVVLGSAANPADSIHGLAFSISYDPKILQAVYFEPLPSWIGDPANGLIYVQRNFPGQNRIDVAISRTDGLPAAGYGVIGRTFIIIEDDIFFRGKDDETESGSGGTGTLSTTLHVRNIRARTPSNTQPEIRPVNTKLVIAKTVGTRPVQDEAATILLSPNPVSEVLRISSPETPIRSVSVLNMWGQLQTVQTELNTNTVNIPVQGWPKGAYLAQVLTNRGISVQLFICNSL